MVTLSTREKKRIEFAMLMSTQAEKEYKSLSQRLFFD
jgi:hypothetical protein